MNKLEVKGYIDVTEEWLENVIHNGQQVKERRYFEYDGKKFCVDNKYVVLDYSEKEIEIANWLVDTFGGEIYMLPRINKPEGIKTADYLWNNEYWDLKTISGTSKQTIYHSVRRNEKQSSNFIFEILNAFLTECDVMLQIDILYNRTDIPFINNVILKQGSSFKVFQRNKKM